MVMNHNLSNVLLVAGLITFSILLYGSFTGHIWLRSEGRPGGKGRSLEELRKTSLRQFTVVGLGLGVAASALALISQNWQ